MAVEGIGNLVQDFADRQLGQAPAVQTGSRLVGAHNVGSGTPEDTFTPSAQNATPQATAQDAGILQLSRGALTAANANFPPTQAAPEANQAVFPPQAASSTLPNGGNAQAVEAPGTGTIAGQATAGPATAAEVQNKIRALNAALPALGLSNNQIQEIDRIAALIKDFNPSTFANLVRQFEAKAEEAQENQAAASGTMGAPNYGTNASGFQVQGIANSNMGPQGSPNSGASGSPSGDQALAGSAGVQVGSAQDTSQSGNRQPGQVLPPQTAGAGTASQPSNQR